MNKNLEITYIDPARLTEYKRNAKIHTVDQIDHIAASIKEFGFNNPILINEKNRIIAGHGRYKAAIKLHLKSIPCIVLSGLSESQERAYILADNKLNLETGFDIDMYRAEIESIIDEMPDFDLQSFGMDAEKYIKEFDQQEEQEEENNQEGNTETKNNETQKQKEITIPLTIHIKQIDAKNWKSAIKKHGSESNAFSAAMEALNA